MEDAMTQSSAALLVEVLLASFFMIACVKAHGPFSREKPSLRDFFHLSGRLERLRRSRWQWFSMIFLVLALRLLRGQPLVFEIILIVQFLIFLALPTQGSIMKAVTVR
jgi:hypothetical protein